MLENISTCYNNGVEANNNPQRQKKRTSYPKTQSRYVSPQKHKAGTSHPKNTKQFRLYPQTQGRFILHHIPALFQPHFSCPDPLLASKSKAFMFNWSFQDYVPWAWYATIQKESHTRSHGYVWHCRRRMPWCLNRASTWTEYFSDSSHSLSMQENITFSTRLDVAMSCTSGAVKWKTRILAERKVPHTIPSPKPFTDTSLLSRPELFEKNLSIDYQQWCFRHQFDIFVGTLLNIWQRQGP